MVSFHYHFQAVMRAHLKNHKMMDSKKMIFFPAKTEHAAKKASLMPTLFFADNLLIISAKLHAPASFCCGRYQSGQFDK